MESPLGEMLKKPQYIALASMALVALIIFNLPAQTMSRWKLAISGVFLPLFGLAGSSQQLLQKTGNTILPRSVLAREAERLRRENEQLKIELKQTSELLRENAQLRQSLVWQKQSPWKLKMARVIARDPANWWRSIQIDSGTNQGARVNLPVLTPDGLVGRISFVGPNRSQVLLLGDPNLRLGALVQDKDVRENGIIMSSASPLDNNMVDLQYFSRNTAIKPGQSVITSGDGGVFPKGILIGQIVDMRNNTAGLSTEARVKVAANLNSLEEVWVMFP
ncbi:MAG: rod shape-determining protein MreC [Verrucomicrobiota bacterium]